jgi:hypothetical protein
MNSPPPLPETLREEILAFKIGNLNITNCRIINIFLLLKKVCFVLSDTEVKYKSWRDQLYRDQLCRDQSFMHGYLNGASDVCAVC